MISAESQGGKFWKSVNICRSYGQLSRGSFFYETQYIKEVTATKKKTIIVVIVVNWL